LLIVRSPRLITDALSPATMIVSNLTGGVADIGDEAPFPAPWAMDDARDNVTQTEAVPKSGTGLPSIVTTASYDSTCSNPITCNQPNPRSSTRPARSGAALLRTARRSHNSRRIRIHDLVLRHEALCF
jgi:hypothetical protein